MLDDYGKVVTTAIKAKNWCRYCWRGGVMLCVTSTYAVLETTNPVLLAACGFVPASLIAIAEGRHRPEVSANTLSTRRIPVRWSDQDTLIIERK